MKDALKNKGKDLKLTTLGFTLIELLAVIVILAIIALITTPIILGIIKDSKNSTTKLSIKNYIRAIELSISKEYMKDPTINSNGICKINENSNGKEIKCGEKNIKVEYNGEGLTSGLIVLENGVVTMVLEGKLDKKYINYENNQIELIDAHPTKEDCFEFDKSTGTIMSYRCVKNNSNVIIPEKIDGVVVKEIGERAFATVGLTSVIIPNTVEKIKAAAFHKNNLSKLIIPEGVKVIETDAFSSNYIKILSLPTTLTSLAYNSFRTNKLREENAYFYKRNNDGSIDYSTLIGYGGELKDIIIPVEKNGVKLTIIGDNAFDFYQLTSVEIPDTVVTIGKFAFRKCGLTELKLSNNIISIYGGSFHGNKLSKIVIPNGCKFIGNDAFSSNYIEELSLPKTLTSLAYNSFRTNKLREENAYFYKRNNDGSIDYSTLIGYGGELKDIIIPVEKNRVKLKTIDVNAFRAQALTNIIIPETVTSIKESAFHNNNLTVLEIPSSVISIGNNCFF